MKYFIKPSAAGSYSNSAAGMNDMVVGSESNHLSDFGFTPSTENSASSVSGVDGLLADNREWAEEQAQKQMDFQTAANKIAMDFSAAEAEKERAFETEMANSAYQRAVADLKKAGLNPILAYSQGGASVPSVSSAQGVTSSGARATTSDIGYTPSQLEYAYRQNSVNNATSILGNLVSAAAMLGGILLKGRMSDLAFPKLKIK